MFFSLLAADGTVEKAAGGVVGASVGSWQRLKQLLSQKHLGLFVQAQLFPLQMQSKTNQTTKITTINCSNALFLVYVTTLPK